VRTKATAPDVLSAQISKDGLGFQVALGIEIFPDGGERIRARVAASTLDDR
jgi:hypothetical protein